MNVFASLFALIMLAIVAAMVTLMAWVSGFWGALGFAVLLFLIYRIGTSESGPFRRPRREELNAFQQPLADDREKDRAR